MQMNDRSSMYCFISGYSPRQEVYEFWLRHPIRQDARNGSDTCPEQVDLRFSLTSEKVAFQLC